MPSVVYPGLLGQNLAVKFVVIEPNLFYQTEIHCKKLLFTIAEVATF